MPEQKKAEPTFTPPGADAALPAVPASVTYTEADRRRVSELWDSSVPATYAGLLDATVEGRES